MQHILRTGLRSSPLCGSWAQGPSLPRLSYAITKTSYPTDNTLAIEPRSMCLTGVMHMTTDEHGNKLSRRRNVQETPTAIDQKTGITRAKPDTRSLQELVHNTYHPRCAPINTSTPPGLVNIQRNMRAHTLPTPQPQAGHCGYCHVFPIPTANLTDVLEPSDRSPSAKATERAHRSENTPEPH